jgi:glycosyl transferase, family 25
MLNYKVFVINLARSPERLTTMKLQLDAIDVPFERIDAVDGRNMSDDFVETVSPAHIVRKSYHRALSKAELACGLSHKKAWQQIVDDDLDFAVVLEDDVELLDNFTAVLELLAGLPHGDWDFIKFYPLTRGGGRNIARRFDYEGHTFVTYHRYPLGFQGQAVSRQGAESLLRSLPFLTEPIDGRLKSWWEAGVFPFGLIPYCVTTDINGVSDINPGAKLEEMQQNPYVKIANKIRRATMRLWSTPKLNRKFRAFTQSLKQTS